MMRGDEAKSKIAPGSAEEPPGVPGFTTWRGVYWFVFVAFVVTVAALALFSRVYA